MTAETEGTFAKEDQIGRSARGRILSTVDIAGELYNRSTTFDFPRRFQVATIVCHSNCAVARPPRGGRSKGVVLRAAPACAPVRTRPGPKRSGRPGLVALRR